MRRLLILGIMALLLLATSVTAHPWYSAHCVGCSGTYHQTFHPHTHYYHATSLTYGYYGWGSHRTTYNFRFPHYNYYHGYLTHYPFAYSFYPNPMYRSGCSSRVHGCNSWYGPGIIW